MSAMAEPTPDEWMGGGGVVAERTNELIDTIIESMNEQGKYRVRPGQIDRVAEKVLPVGHEDTLFDYRVRAVRYGPFEKVEVGGLFELPEEYREARP